MVFVSARRRVHTWFSRRYVEAILSKLPASQLHLSTPIVGVSTPQQDTVTITSTDGRSHVFDRVILACHSDMALSLIQAGQGITQREATILKRFAWSRNEVVLHNDTRVRDDRPSTPPFPLRCMSA